MQAKLEAGIIIPIEESNLNTYQVDEDSTIPDEGTIVPE